MELSDFPLFTSFSANEFHQLQQELNFQHKVYRKEERVCRNGDILKGIGIVQTGRLALYHENIDGELGLISYIEEGECFGESYALLHMPSPVSIVALQDCEVCFITVPTTILPSLSLQKFMSILNQMLAKKNTVMNERMHILTYKKMRSRLLAYFQNLSSSQKSDKITLPFTRQAMADYLCIDRSAMCRELSNMERDGLILIEKQRIHVQHL